MKTTNLVNLNEMNFDQLFKQISTKQTCYNLFPLLGKLLEKDTVITAGKKEHYNSMTGSLTGLAFLFKKPTTWCIFREDRYTLELILKEQTYTLSYFPNEYKKQVLILGSKSGRDSDKMKKVELTGVQTPNGDMSFKEASLIIECKLTISTTVNPYDIYAQEVKDNVYEEYKEANHYRKFVFGEITYVWVKKKE
jgi:flavin reductase (DIM6/NTAB) family NADH-FMN oxidoreductase RutF